MKKFIIWLKNFNDEVKVLFQVDFFHAMFDVEEYENICLFIT